MPLPQCIEDVHDMRARSREVHTDLWPCCPITRVRHKKQAQVQNIQQNEFKGVQAGSSQRVYGGSRRSSGGGCRGSRGFARRFQ